MLLRAVLTMVTSSWTTVKPRLIATNVNEVARARRETIRRRENFQMEIRGSWLA
jgi:hypothetical protein